MSLPSQPINHILFDLDGTLLDTAQDLAAALNRLLEEEKRDPLPFEAIRPVVSNGGNALVQLGFNTQLGEPQHEILYQRLLNIYGEQVADRTDLFPGMQTILDWIANNQLSWGIVTNKPSTYTLPILERLNLQPTPGSVVCPDHVKNRKPDPEALLLACKENQRQANQSVYVGDHGRDVEAGKRAGMLTIGVLYGYIEADDNPQDWGADLLVADTEALFIELQRLASSQINDHASNA